MTVNWHVIRNHSGSQDQGFEELCSQLFHNEPPADAVRFERRGYRDAGLECAHVVRNGSLWGMQAKFFTRSPSSDEWGQVDKSVKTALEKNPTLKHLIICIPQNFDDPKIANQSHAMDKWKGHKAAWEDLARVKGLQVEFELWDDTQLTRRLTQTGNRGKLWYFFNRAELTPEWFLQRVEEVAEDAKPRYTEELNIRLPIAQLFEGLGRTQDFSREPRKQHRKLARSLDHLSSQNCPLEARASVEEVSRLGRSLTELIAGIDFLGVASLPLNNLSDLSGRLRDAAHTARRILGELEAPLAAAKRAEWEANGKAGTFYHSPAYEGLRGIHWEIASAAHHLNGFAEGAQARLANRPVLLVTGTAGKGKTHLFTDVAKRRAASGQPTIVLLGENFRDSDPLTQILDLVGMRLDRDEFLQALEAAAEASGGRLLLMIDALNEGAGLQVWPRRLSGFLKMLERHPWIGVALSVRTTYEDAVVPEPVRKAAIRVVHEGFAARPEEAARAFFSHYNLNLPKIPLLKPEFTDPLFLKLLCQGLRDEGLHDIPEGHEGISRVFDFLMEATNRKLRRSGKLNTGPHQNPVRECLSRIADALAEADTDALPLSAAEHISHELYPSDGYADSLLACLISEGLLATEMLRSSDAVAPQHGVAFAYQRFGDHEIARRLIERHLDPSDHQIAFGPSGGIGRLFGEYYCFYRYKGLLEALTIQVPERTGQELVDLFHPSLEGAQDEAASEVLAECLMESLLWRRKDAITDNTFPALEQACSGGNHYSRYLDVLLTLAAVPDHPLNAERLHAVLMSVPLPDRDETWAVWIHHHCGEESAVDRLLTWCLLGDDKSHLTDASVLLACVAVSWLTASTVRPIRDRATKALVRVLSSRPHLVAELLGRFSDTDDPYISERLYAAVYGVALRLSDAEQFRQLAMGVYERLFAHMPAVPHIMVRDYGRCVIERAVIRGCHLPFDIADVRPPYGSNLPPDPPSRQYFESLVPPTADWTDRDRAFSHIVNRFGDFDISRFAGGPSLRDVRFSAIPLLQELPPSRRLIREAWENALSDDQRELWEEIEALRFQQVRVDLSAYTDEQLEELLDLAEASDEAEEEAQSQDDIYAAACSAFRDILTPAQRAVFDETVLVSASPGADDLPALDRDLVVRWVVQRALELGWTPERFAGFDASIERMKSYGHGEPLHDTVGTKYLWIAYYEVLARLADNFRMFKEYSHDVAEAFDGSWEAGLRTLDPSCLPAVRQQNLASPGTGSVFWLPKYYDVDDVVESHDEWVQRSDDLPSVSPLLVVRDSEETEWVVLESYPNYEQKSDIEEDLGGSQRRNLWLHLRGYLVRKETAQQVFDWMREQDFMNRWMPEGSDSYEVFLGEFYDSPAWRHHAFGAQWQYSDWLRPERGCPAEVAFVKLGYSQSSEDASTADTDAVRTMLPAPLLVREANLRWNGEVGMWVGAAGAVVVQDPSVGTGGRGALLMRRDVLDRFLADRGYELLWTVLGEKIVHNWRKQHPRLEISGSVRYSAGALAEALRMKYVAG